MDQNLFKSKVNPSALIMLLMPVTMLKKRKKFISVICISSWTQIMSNQLKMCCKCSSWHLQTSDRTPAPPFLFHLDEEHSVPASWQPRPRAEMSAEDGRLSEVGGSTFSPAQSTPGSDAQLSSPSACGGGLSLATCSSDILCSLSSP